MSKMVCIAPVKKMVCFAPHDTDTDPDRQCRGRKWFALHPTTQTHILFASAKVEKMVCIAPHDTDTFSVRGWRGVRLSANLAVIPLVHNCYPMNQPGVSPYFSPAGTAAGITSDGR